MLMRPLQVVSIVGAAATSFAVHSWPATASIPTGKGLLNPGMCLQVMLARAAARAQLLLVLLIMPTHHQAGPASPSGFPGVLFDKIGAKCLKFKVAGGAIEVLRSGREAWATADPQCLGISVPQPPCWYANSSVHNATMCNPHATPTQRAKDLVARMTLAEKGHNMGGDGGWGGSSGVPRLGATASCLNGQKAGILDSSEALHGLGQASCGATTYWPQFNGNNTGCPASFPHAQALGCTFNRSLFSLIGDRISTEARAAYNIGKDAALWLWAPDINLFRDPRWGRGQEVPGEGSAAWQAALDAAPVDVADAVQ